ncbi:ankyrin repeat domain-containing protein [Streptomyces sp. NPDC088400]|uniref:ankyrin repeat domain-containing protein n=1 Tax=Streptomyces sp. NPDC088400 TaxID=3365861 RepID=UPI0037F6817E
MTDEPAAGTDELFEAVYGGENDVVVRLLRAGVPAEATDRDGQTALYLAAVSDEAGLVRLLLAAGADPQRASGPERGDLPLCAAACGGHTEVVRALLAAGARPDSREDFGFTAGAWAVVQGFPDTLEALLEYGADPDLPGPNGEPLLLLAARRGSTPSVRVLLRYGAGARAGAADDIREDTHEDRYDGMRHGAREAALAEARRWMALDVEQELRDGLLRAYGDGYETVVRRIEEDGSMTVVVELLRDGAPMAGQEQQTGHAAVATLLETELGIATPYEELAGRALRCGDPGRDDWTESVAALSRRGDEETFQAAAAWCASDEPLRQAFAAGVLARLGTADGTDGASPFTARAVPLLRELSREAAEPELVRVVVRGLGLHGDPAVLPEILRHTAHPDAGVRREVALALAGLAPTGLVPTGLGTTGNSDRDDSGGADHAGVRALILLSRDADASVRDRAVPALAEVDADTHEIREALAARLNDPDADTAAEAAKGLAVRQDPRAIDVLARILADEEHDGYARATAMAAVRYVPYGPERQRLECTLPRRR